MENEVNSITLIDEDGNEVEFDVLMKLDIEEKEYVIVAPADDEDEEEGFALRIEKNEKGEDILVTVDDDDEFQMVSEAYETLASEDELN